MNRYDLQKLAAVRMKDARVPLLAGRFEAAYYLVGYAVECALKACIAKQTKRYDFPSHRQWSASVYTHNLVELLKLANLQAILDADARSKTELAANWNMVKHWSEESRYPEIRKVDAEGLYRAATDRRFGVFRWIEVKSALWSKGLFDRWTLVLVSPVVDDIGIREAYLKVLKILKHTPAHDRPKVDELGFSLYTPKSYYAKSLRQGLKKARDLHVSHQPVGDHFIDEGFIYFVN